MVAAAKATVPTITDQASAMQLSQCAKNLAAALAELRTAAQKVRSWVPFHSGTLATQSRSGRAGKAPWQVMVCATAGWVQWLPRSPSLLPIAGSRGVWTSGDRLGTGSGAEPGEGLAGSQGSCP